MTILGALDDPHLLGAAFPDPETWRPWRAFLAAVFGLPMTADQAAIFTKHTGRSTPPEVPAREVWCIAGRRAGKSRIAALLAVFVAAFRDYRNLLAPGEKATVAVIAADRQQARVVFRYITGLLDTVPMLRALVVRQTASAVELRGHVVIEVHTRSYRSTRGYSFAAVIADEVGYWHAEDSASPDAEVLTAVRPGLATIPGSMLVAISSPYSRRGALWTAYRQHHGQDGDPVLVWQADTRSMNPTVPEHVVADALAADEAAARAEWLAEFRSDLEAFVSREVIEAASVPGRIGLPPVGGVRYRGFTDPSGGSSDAFALAIAHGEDRDGVRVVVLDYLSERRPPFSPDAVAREFAEALQSYGVTTVQADHYAGAWTVEAFQRHGIACEQSAEPKSVIYANALPLLNSRRVELLDHPRLQAQLLRLGAAHRPRRTRLDRSRGRRARRRGQRRVRRARGGGRRRRAGDVVPHAASLRAAPAASSAPSGQQLTSADRHWFELRLGDDDLNAELVHPDREGARRAVASAQRLAGWRLVLPPHARLREELLNLVYEVGPQGVRVIDKGKVHQDHAVAIRGAVASLAQQGGGLFLLYKAEYERLRAAGA